MKMYRADFDNDLESDYFEAKNDDEAITYAITGKTEEYSDVGSVYGELIELFEVNPNTECFNEIRVVWH